MQELLLLSAYVYLSKLCQGEWNRKNHAGIFRGLRENCLKEWTGKNTSSGNLGKKGSTKFQRGTVILKSPVKQLETCKST